MLDTLIQGLTSPLGLFAVLASAGIMLVFATFTSSVKQKGTDPMERLRQQAKAVPGQTNRPLSRHEAESEIQKRLSRYKAFLEPASETEKSAARLEMIQAGYHGKNAVRDFHASKMILAIAGLAIGLGLNFLNSGDTPPSTIMMIATIMGPTFAGYYLPIYWVGKRRTERQDQIASGFPDALDMLLICTEAGQSMDQSIARIARELKSAYPALAEEFETVAHQVKAGKDRLDVLREMGERCGNADIRSFVTVLIQSATYGTSTADALRVYAAEMRDKRVMLAEEKANVLPTKLTLGTMMFTVPPLLIILIGPSVYGVTTFLNSAEIGF
jgi:tight adherence protein C